MIGLLLHFLCLTQSIFVRCEYVKVCQERCSLDTLFFGSARKSCSLIVAEGNRVGIQLSYARARENLPIGAPKVAPCVGCDVDVGDLRPRLSSARDVDGEACFDGVGLSGHHSVGRRIFYRDDEVCVLRRADLLGVRENIRSARGFSEGVGGMDVCFVEFWN